MTATIDQRVVSMKFDNKQFESGVTTTLSSLAKLKSGLNLTGATKGLDNISSSAKKINLDGAIKGLENVSDAAKKVNFDGATKGVETFKQSFSALEIAGVTALVNITNSALEAGKNLVKSLALDPIMDGFREYETQMNAVQTILANTSSKGSTLDDVNAALAELNTYSDKTIYNFTEMTKNIGTFTAAGVDLDSATSAIKGIANLAAVSGSTSQQASTAMYQLSQAIASGKVNLQDWNSVVNAGMGGQVFQDALKRTAINMGKNIDASQSFRESISDKDGTGWLTSDVLVETLKEFTGDMSEAELAAQGYTESQIKDIMAMGVTATDAATKVKTFTQLLDTLKEAVGSGWAKTWQTIFGDFEEAKTMFTSVSDTLGAMIGQSADARNNMLDGWKELGGRTALIDSIKNAFDGLMGVVNAVGGAFRDIFPRTTSEQLYNMTLGLKNLTEGFKMSDTTLNNLRSTFKGFFAILDIGKQILVGVLNGFSSIIGGAGNLGSTILGVTGSFGEWLTAVDNAIKSSGVINNVFIGLGKAINTGLNGASTIIQAVISTIGSLTSAIGSKINFDGFKALETFLGLFGKTISGVGDLVSDFKGTVTNTFSELTSSIDFTWMISMFAGISKGIQTAIETIGKAFTWLRDKALEIFDGDINNIFKAFGQVSLGALGLSIAKFINGLGDSKSGFETFKEMFESAFTGVKETLDSVRGCFEEYQNNLKAGTLMKIAAAIGILAASIVAISKIDGVKLASSLAAIGGLFTQLLVAMKLYTMIGDLKGSALKASTVMISMSTAILILSSAMVKLGQLDWEGIAKGGVGITILITELVLASKALSSNSGSMMKGALGMIAFSEAIKILASAMIPLASMDWNELTKGLVGVGVLMTEISLFLNNTKFGGKVISTSIGIILLASAMKILASACGTFGSMDWSSISKGLVSIGALLTELTLFSKMTANSKNLISTSLGLIGIATAMTILSVAMNSFGNMSWEGISKGLIAIGVSLTEIGLALKLMPSSGMISTSTGLILIGAALNIIAMAMNSFSNMSWEGISKGLVMLGVSLTEIGLAVKMMPQNMPIIGAGLVLVGGALNIIAMAMNSFGNMSWEGISKGLVMLGGSLTILSIGLNTMTGTLAGSAALLVASGALALLAPSLVLLGGMSWSSIISGLTMLAGTIAIFGGAAALLTPVIPSMLGLAGALTLLGVAVLSMGGGLALAGVGLTSLSAAFLALETTSAAGAAAIVASLGVIILGVADLIPQVLTKIGEGLVAFCQALTDGIPAICECVTTAITAIVNLLVTNVPTIVNGIFQILTAVLQSLITWAPQVTQQISQLILAMLKVIADNMGNFVTAGVNIVVNFIKGVADNLPKVIDSAFKLILSFINGLADAIRSNSGPIADACANLVGAVVEGIGNLGSKFVEAGANAVKGFIKGLGNLAGDLIEAGANLGRRALDAAKNALDIHSPSREFAQVGVYSGQGFINGLENMGSKVYDAAYTMGRGALDSIKNSVSKISDAINTDMDSSPVITPVLDLSNIQNGTSQINSMVGDLDKYNLDGSVKMSSSISRGMNKPTIEPQPITQPKSIVDTPQVKQPVTLKLLLQNGREIAEYLIDDIDSLMGSKNIITGRGVGR